MKKPIKLYAVYDFSSKQFVWKYEGNPFAPVGIRWTDVPNSTDGVSTKLSVAQERLKEITDELTPGDVYTQRAVDIGIVKISMERV